MTRLGVRYAAMLGAMVCATTARAQSLDPQHFQPAATLTGFTVVKGGATDRPFDMTAAAWLIYGKEQLVAVQQDGTRLPLVDNRLELVLSYAMGLPLGPLAPFLPGLDVGVSLPVVLWQTGHPIENGLPSTTTRSQTGLGDPRVEARIGILSRERFGVNLALVPVVTVPLGKEFLGSDSLTFTPELAASTDIGRVSVAANVGYRLREAQSVSSLTITDELTWRAGVGFELVPAGKRHTVAMVEAFGLTRAAAPFADIRQSPLEVVMSVRRRQGDVVGTVGVGSGLNAGYGTPVVRAIASAAYAPRVFDADADGVTDERDQCPTVVEDADAFEDEDGCPEADNDKDGLLDQDDACPDAAEDADAFLDDDGCPDPDNDVDGVLDADDKCASDAEDKDGYQDDDGCPDDDDDADTITDARDKCPREPEDKDGWEDADGCPEPDNDGDGILDVNDKCPLAGEDINNYKDDDGCPDAKDDKDGDDIIDKVDKCPKEPEDRDAFEDEDGCPEMDNDKDGVPDATDACAMEPEDKDGFMDEDGCPEEDNDGDGIWDAADKCPVAPEVINGFEDSDGCPDEGAPLVKLTAEKIEIKEAVYFDTGSAVIQARSHGLLDQVAAVLKNHAELKKLRVEGHTDDQGSDEFNLKLSQGRANAVRDYLVSQGVDTERLEALGYGESRPIASNRTSRGREVNRRVEFTIVEQAGKQAP